MSLRSNSVGFLQLAFLSVCAILPGSIYLVVSRNAIAYAGAAAPLAFLLGALLVFTNVNSIYQFSSRVSSAGGFYKFVEAAWGRRAAGVIGMAQLLAQLSPIIITPIALAWILDVALRALYNIAVPLPLLVALGLLAQAFMFAVSYLGVRLSARVAMISGAAQMAAILAGSVVIVLRSRYLSLEPFTMPSVGPAGFFLAVLTGPYTAYIGYSTIVNFGEEARAPRETIRKAIVAAIIMMAAFYTFVEYSLVVSVPPSGVQGLRSLFLPAVAVFSRYTGRAYSALVLAIAISGYFTGVLVFGSSAERTMFSLARDGLLPRYLCRVHERYGSPSSACITTFAVAVVMSLLTEAVMVELYGVVRGLLYGILFWITVMSVLNLAYHVAVNVSLSRVAVRERLRGLVAALSHHLLPAIGTAISLVIIYFSLVGLNVPVLYAVPAMAAYLAAAIALVVRRLRG